MIVPKKILDTWKLQREHGDVEAMHQLSIKSNKRVSRITLGKALNTGRVNVQNFELIRDFYLGKRQATKDLIQETIK